MPTCRILIDISAQKSVFSFATPLKSLTLQPLRHLDQALHGLDLGTSGLILQAQSREEILADKIIALAFRENRIKNRDLWDIAWLTQQGIELPTHLIPIKIRDHQRENAEFVTLLTERIATLQSQPAMREEFMKEMRRFLPAATVRDAIENEAYWSYLADLVDELGKKAMASLK